MLAGTNNCFLDQIILESIWKEIHLVTHDRQEVNQELYKSLYISDQCMIKFHFLLRMGKSSNTEHMLTHFSKRDLHQNMNTRTYAKELEKKQII